jgi:hypothetical protein
MRNPESSEADIQIAIEAITPAARIGDTRLLRQELKRLEGSIAPAALDYAFHFLESRYPELLDAIADEPMPLTQEQRRIRLYAMAEKREEEIRSQKHPGRPRE